MKWCRGAIEKKIHEHPKNNKNGSYNVIHTSHSIPKKRKKKNEKAMREKRHTELKSKIILYDLNEREIRIKYSSVWFSMPPKLNRRRITFINFV